MLCSLSATPLQPCYTLQLKYIKCAYVHYEYMCLVYIKSCPHTSHNMLNGGYFGNKFECDATRYTNILCILYYVGRCVEYDKIVEFVSEYARGSHSSYVLCAPIYTKRTASKKRYNHTLYIETGWWDRNTSPAQWIF